MPFSSAIRRLDVSVYADVRVMIAAEREEEGKKAVELSSCSCSVAAGEKFILDFIFNATHTVAARELASQINYLCRNALSLQPGERELTRIDRESGTSERGRENRGWSSRDRDKLPIWHERKSSDPFEGRPPRWNLADSMDHTTYANDITVTDVTSTSEKKTEQLCVVSQSEIIEIFVEKIHRQFRFN